jgi:tRNA 2-thiouridine synthesizing protein A
MAAEELLDARGLMCPEPIRLTQAILEDMPAGATLRVLATDPAAPIDFEAWCEALGHQLLDCQHKDGVWIIRLRRSKA